MGQRIQFDCPACGYSTMAAREQDCGMRVSCEYVNCLDCKEVVAVVVERRHGPVSADEGRCPDCAGTNFADWMSDAKCPRCGDSMTEGDMICMWD